jgi:hypothetical protein
MFMVASATGDASNVSNLTAGDSIPEWRLVPNDNNIGQRNVFPVAAGSGLKGLVAALDGQRIRIKNPHRAAARIIVSAQLPKFLAERGWTTAFDNPGAGAFALKSGEVKGIVLRLKPGREFTAQDVVKARADAVVHVTATADGIVVGGMSYVLDAKLTGEPPVQTVPALGKRASGRKRAVPPKRRSSRKAGRRR